MVNHRIIEKPAFDVIGKKAWISGQDNDLFGYFWANCQQEKLFELFERLRGSQTGVQTNGSLLGISRVEADPENRAFYYMIAIKKPGESPAELELYTVPAAQWAVFECVGKVPEAIVNAEIYAFTEWLPASKYEHARAPEMEVYFPRNDGLSADSYCEFWLPVTEK